MANSIIKKLSDFKDAQPSLETAMGSAIGSYDANSLQIYDISYHSELNRLCVVGSYTNTDISQTAPFVGFYNASLGSSYAAGTWVISDLSSQNDSTADNVLEAAGLFGLVEIPSSSLKWTYGWVAVGHVPDNSYTVGQDDFLSPLIVEIDSTGTTTVLSSEQSGTFKPSGWPLTQSGGASVTRPYMLCGVVYDDQNDAIVTFGSLKAASPSILSFAFIVEMTGSTSQPTYAFSNNYGKSSGVGHEYPAFFRSASLQTIDPSGAIVSNRTVVMLVGYSEDLSGNPLLEGRAVIAFYQPHFSNAWGSAAPRLAWLDRGINNGDDFYDQQGLAADNKPKDLSLCKRITVDGDDVYVVGGLMSGGGVFGYVFKGLLFGDSNIINQVGINTTVNVDDLRNISSDLNGTLPTGFTTGNRSTLWDMVGIADRKTKVYSVGLIYYGRNAPLSPDAWVVADGTRESTIFSVSRGFGYYTAEAYDTMITGSLDAGNVRMKMAVYDDATYTSLLFTQAAFESSITTASLYEARISTGHRALAWFEYLLYDGVDSLIARKLNEMGVRVTIANVEWYKQDILKQGLDVSTDFFNEWATLQVSQNEERERVAEQFGKKRPPKRQTRTDIFDDYADYESKTEAVEQFPDYDPNKDGDPFKDDVALTQEVEKTQKAVDDLRRIEDVVEKETPDESEYDGASDVSDYGEN